MLTEAKCKPRDTVICTDGSVTRDQFGWVLWSSRTDELYVKRGVPTVPSLTVEADAATHVVQRLTSHSNTKLTHATIFTTE